MTNRITGPNTPPAGTGSGAGVARTRDTGAPAAASSPPGSGYSSPGDLHITDTATRLAALEQTLRDLPAIDQARVDELRSAIEQGRYVVRPESIASRLVQMEQALRRLAGGQK